jgi:hypothetical protein
VAAWASFPAASALVITIITLEDAQGTPESEIEHRLAELARTLPRQRLQRVTVRAELALPHGAAYYHERYRLMAAVGSLCGALLADAGLAQGLHSLRVEGAQIAPALADALLRQLPSLQQLHLELGFHGTRPARPGPPSPRWRCETRWFRVGGTRARATRAAACWRGCCRRWCRCASGRWRQRA